MSCLTIFSIYVLFNDPIIELLDMIKEINHLNYK